MKNQYRNKEARVRRKKDADARTEASSALTVDQRLAALDAAGFVATKERAKLKRLKDQASKKKA
jgi:hypothetical protein